jgi:uncharacterized protein YidB (DUF937 family)
MEFGPGQWAQQITNRRESRVWSGSLAIGLQDHSGVAAIVVSIIQRHGGIEGLMHQFQASGLRSAIQSWVLPGPNRSITAEQVQQAVGPGLMCELAAQMGVSPQALAIRLTVLLPATIDALTPEGCIPGRRIP